MHTSTSCDCGYANPSDNWGDVPNTLNRSLGSDRGEAGDIREDDIREDASLVACNPGDVNLAVCGPARGPLQEVEFPVAEFQEVSRRQVVVVRDVQSPVAGSVDYRRRGDRPTRARQEVARRSVDDSSKSPLQRHLPAVYSDDQG